ncbi:MAG TPA: EGF domain-containing protein [Kofleriaceae bacterium]|nr:EGF domain-containing protein [Kofleriaceae bacterium]
MRIKILSILAVVAACGGDDSGGTVRDGGVDGKIIDAPEIMPSITSFVASPSQVAAGTATPVTFTWTYGTEPTFPDPACSIDNGVGAVTKGQSVPITINVVTTFTLTCTNPAGTAQRQVVIGVPPVAPVLGTFTVSPTSVAPNTATPLTFTWTYSNTPSPAPTCTVDGDVGAVTSGTPVSVTLPQARTFRIKCTNTQGTTSSGSTVADVTVAVNECGTAAAQCDAHATCTDTTNSYTCACNNGYTGNGDTCSAVVNDCVTTPALCDANAVCVGGTQCSCKAGYIGDGSAAGTGCARERITFVTAATGQGNLSAWAGATGTGLAAADSICAAAATARSLPGIYRAWMSDATSDAYCRAHNLLGVKKANSCGLGALPVAAGPWVRTGDSNPVFPTIDKLLAPTRQTFYAANRDEAGTEIASAADRVWTATDDSGVYTTNTCGDWTSNSSAAFGGVGAVFGGGTSWTRETATDPACSNSYHLRCVEVNSGPALPPRHPQGAYKKAFITSVTGNGNLFTWPDANGVTGFSAANAICQSRARYAGYANPQTFKAFMTYYPYSISSWIVNSTYPYVRPDGVQLGATRADLLDNKLGAAWDQTELNVYRQGNADAGAVWTGLSTTGSYATTLSSYLCSSWSYAGSGYYGSSGRYDLADGRALYISTTGSTCDLLQPIYCVED